MGSHFVQALISQIKKVPTENQFGRVVSVQGLLVEIAGGMDSFGIGARINIEAGNNNTVPCEVVGFRGGRALCMPFDALEGVRMGCRADIKDQNATVHPSPAWLGRVVNAFGEPIDGKGPLAPGGHACPIRQTPPPAHLRQRVGEKVDLGVRALNSFVTACRGQRMGIFAGSGVGKSVLLSMLARNTACDVAVIGLIGERGREVQEFIEDDLGEEGLKRSVVVVATSDEPALRRRQAAYMTMALAEYFRDQDQHVLCLMDSVTRFAMAQREIGLSGGEPPAAKGYTPTVFAELPKLLERAGPGAGAGSITGLFTVLVEGDDHNEPIADAVRGILDGHIVLERAIAERGRYPAINILKSISRTLPNCNTDEQNQLITEARRYMALYNDMAELIRLGAYRSGSDPDIDRAIRLNDQLEAFLSQGKQETATLDDGYALLQQILESEQQPPEDPQSDPSEPERTV